MRVSVRGNGEGGWVMIMRSVSPLDWCKAHCKAMHGLFIGDNDFCRVL